MFARFLEKLRSTPDGDGTLLDHSMIFYGGGMGNPERASVRPAAGDRRSAAASAAAIATSSCRSGRRSATCG